MDKSVVVGTYFHKYEAQIVQGLLDSCGIKAVISSDDLGGFREHLTLGTGNIKVLVHEQDADQAREILTQNDQEPGDADSEE